MAVADADYKFQYFDVGAYGSEGDSSVFRGSSFGTALKERKLNLPISREVNRKPIPYFFVADDAFPLDNHIQKPYKPSSKSTALAVEERIFNYRLSRARRTVENAFGILCCRWMCLAGTMLLKPDRAQKIITACCMLHNFLMSIGRDEYAPNGFSDTITENGVIEGLWRNRLNANSLFHNHVDVPGVGRLPQNAKEIRNHLKSYFSSEEGKVSWQNAAVFNNN